jgi:PiT family inorganic phosphate transporter
MDVTCLIFLSSGLFLGWSLGANDAANVFGTAVGSRMVRFSTAVVICAVFVVLGAVVSGGGASAGLGALGAITALGGAFTVALAAALTVYGMTVAGLPVSTTQAIVGAIIGWNLFSGTATDLTALSRITGTWVASPLLGAAFAWILYRLARLMIRITKPHLLILDQLLRVGFVAAGIVGAYSLGANNIANVVGVFVPAARLDTTTLGPLVLSGEQRLFAMGAMAIAVGTMFSRPVMMTVGRSLMTLNPVGGLVVVTAQAMVLFLFSSTSLQALLLGVGVHVPLVPVSSSQAVVGAVVGVALARGFKGLRQIQWTVLRNIAVGWVLTPTIAAVISYVALYIVQNVFEQEVYTAAVGAVGAVGAVTTVTAVTTIAS